MGLTFEYCESFGEISLLALRPSQNDDRQPSPGHAQEVHQLRVVGVHHEHLHQRLDEPGALVVVPETRVPWR